jgi:hypothetical protein
MKDTKLLVRIDERQKKMAIDMVEIKKCLKSTVMDDEEFKQMKSRLDTLWDDRNKLIGWMIGTGVIGGAVGSALKQLGTAILAK